MRRKIIALTLVALVLIGVLPPGLAAGTPRVIFESGAEDANGVFEVSVKVYDATYWGLQFALKYDPEVIQPVDANGGAVDISRVDSVMTAAESWMDAFPTAFESDQGLLGGVLAVPPGSSGPQLNDMGSLEVGSEGRKMGTIRFKRLRDGDTGLEIATEAKGAPFHDELPEGIAIVDVVAGTLDVEVTFREADKPSSGKSESFKPTAEPQPEKDPKELLEGAVMLKIGSHAAVCKGAVTAIYFGERNITAYAHDNRTFVPVRFVGERLGATVGWDNETQSVTVEKDGHKIEMAIGSSTYYLDGEAKTLDAPAELAPSVGGNSRTMVPIRFVSEALGYQVEWDQARNLVVIVPSSLNWDKDGEAEAQAMDQAITNLALYSMFV